MKRSNLMWVDRRGVVQSFSVSTTNSSQVSVSSTSVEHSFSCSLSFSVFFSIFCFLLCVLSFTRCLNLWVLSLKFFNALFSFLIWSFSALYHVLCLPIFLQTSRVTYLFVYVFTLEHIEKTHQNNIINHTYIPVHTYVYIFVNRYMLIYLIISFSLFNPIGTRPNRRLACRWLSAISGLPVDSQPTLSRLFDLSRLWAPLEWIDPTPRHIAQTCPTKGKQAQLNVVESSA